MDYVVFNQVKLETLVALSEKEQAEGLMFQASPMIMSFPYDNSQIRKFWMKNTPVALDIVFCNNNRVISIEDGIPFSLNKVGPLDPSDLVVELPKGRSVDLGIVLGTPVKMFYSLSTLAKKYQLTLAKFGCKIQ